MVTCEAVVTRSEPGWVWLETRESSCAACQGACLGQSGLDSPAGAGRVFKFPTAQGFKPGARVVIAIPESLLLKASLKMYLLPLLGFFAGAAIASEFGYLVPAAWREFCIMIAGFAGLATVYGWLRASPVAGMASQTGIMLYPRR